METLSISETNLADRTAERLLVQAWRAEQLRRLGVPAVLAAILAERVDWHELESLIERGCPPDLALEIVL